MRFLIPLGCAALILFSGCVKDTRPVLTVGQFSFSAKDIEQRGKVLRFYYPNEKGTNVRKELAKGYRQIQVLLNHGFEGLRERVIAEEKRIDHSTLDPVGLAKIKAIFDNDVEAYRRLYLMPLLGPRLLSEFAGRDNTVQAKSRKRITAFLDVVEKNPARFVAEAKKEKLTRRAIRVSEEHGVRYDNAPFRDGDRFVAANPSEEVSPILTEQWKQAAMKSENSEAQRWVREMAVSLKPGAVSPRIVDKGEVWMAVKFIGTDKKTNEVIFEAAEVPKDNSASWIEAETAKINVVGE